MNCKCVTSGERCFAGSWNNEYFWVLEGEDGKNKAESLLFARRLNEMIPQCVDKDDNLSNVLGCAIKRVHRHWQGATDVRVSGCFAKMVGDDCEYIIAGNSGICLITDDDAKMILNRDDNRFITYDPFSARVCGDLDRIENLRIALLATEALYDGERNYYETLYHSLKAENINEYDNAALCVIANSAPTFMDEEDF